MSCRTRRAQPPDRPMHPTASLTPSRGGAADSAAPQPVARVEVPAIHLTFTRDLPLSQSALEFAVKRHAGQTRGADRADFVFHPVEVGSILERLHYPDYVVAAGVLHDVLEDTDAERRDIEARFGPEVAELVVTLSDDPSIGDEERRREDLRERVRRGRRLRVGDLCRRQGLQGERAASAARQRPADGRDRGQAASLPGLARDARRGHARVAPRRAAPLRARGPRADSTAAAQRR